MPRIAQIHKKVFGDHFLGKLPEKVIQKFYNEFYGADCFLVATTENRVVGFVLGGWSSELSSAQKRFVEKNKMHSFFSVLFSPLVWIDTIKRVTTIIKLLKKANLNEKGNIKLKNNYRLLSIGVDSDFQRRNIASTLMVEFEKIVFTKVASYGLSVHDCNSKAIALYLKMGFVEERRETDSVYFIKQKQN